MEIEEYRKMDTEEDRMWWYLATRKIMLRYLLKFLPEPTGRILDSGCGTGGFLKLLAGALPGAQAFGIELDGWAAEKACQKSGYPVTRGSIHQLPFAEQAFSTIVSTDVIYHQGVDQQKAISESYRCLQEGGIFLVQVPAYRWMRSAHDKRVFGARRYTRGEVEGILRDAGFSILLSTYRTTLLFPLMVLQRKFLTSEGDESDVKPFPIFIEWFFNVVMVLEQTILGAGLRFPFGGSVVVIGVKNG